MKENTLKQAITYVYSQQVKDGNKKGKFNEKDGSVHMHHAEMTVRKLKRSVCNALGILSLNFFSY